MNLPDTHSRFHREVFRDERRAYRVVDLFEQELCVFTGAPFAVAVNSCTNALFLSLMWERQGRRELELEQLRPVRLPRRTYIGVLQAVLNAGFGVRWDDFVSDWQKRGWYTLQPLPIVDAARALASNAYRFGHTCLSFHSAKQLPIGRGGAILTDNEEAAEWFRAARMDGRAPGDGKPPVFPGFHCPLPPDAAARGLDILSRWEKDPEPLPYTDYPDLSEWYPGV